MFLIADYFIWHYTLALRDILNLLVNYMLAVWHLFFIGAHARTLLSPWHRIKAGDIVAPSTLGERLGNIVVDIFFRGVAAIIRLAIIVMGLFFEIIVLAFFIGLFILWVFWPFIFLWALMRGISLVIA